MALVLARVGFYHGLSVWLGTLLNLQITPSCQGRGCGFDPCGGTRIFTSCIHGEKIDTIIITTRVAD